MEAVAAFFWKKPAIEVCLLEEDFFSEGGAEDLGVAEGSDMGTRWSLQP